MIQIDLRPIFFQMGWFNPPLETLGKAMDSRVFFFDDLFDSQVAEFWVRVFFWVGCQGVKVCKKTQERDQNLQAR